MTTHGHSTLLTVSEVHGTGADIMTHGTGTRTDHGTTEAGTTHGTVGMTLGSTADTGADGMIHGTTVTAAGTADTGDLIIQAGTADGIRTGDTITDGTPDITAMATMLTHGEVSDIRQALTEYSAAGHLCAEDLEPHRLQDVTSLRTQDEPAPVQLRLRPAG